MNNHIGWISFKERTPENRQLVFLAVRRLEGKNTRDVAALRYTNDCFERFLSHGCEVVYWMPAPDWPEVDEGDAADA